LRYGRGSGFSQNERPALAVTVANMDARGSRPLVRASPRTMTVQIGYRLCREQQPVGEFPTLRLAQKAAEQATDY
jgi:hypothetical protein